MEMSKQKEEKTLPSTNVRKVIVPYNIDNTNKRKETEKKQINSKVRMERRKSEDYGEVGMSVSIAPSGPNVRMDIVLLRLIFFSQCLTEYNRMCVDSLFFFFLFFSAPQYPLRVVRIRLCLDCLFSEISLFAVDWNEKKSFRPRVRDRKPVMPI